MHRSCLPCVLAAGFVALSLNAAEAARVKVWHHATPAPYEKARLHHAVVSSTGTLRLARKLEPLTGLAATHVWDLVEDRAGALWAATGDEGKVYRVPAGSTRARVAYTAEQSQVLCLALGADGSVYAGTGPAGKVVRLGPGGDRVLCDLGESYIWALAADAKSGVLYAGTGPHGRIYRITPDGKASVLYATRQEHVLCLTVGPDGNVYAGTDKEGLVYRIDPRGKPFVLFQAPQPEVRAIRVADGALYVGTSAPTRRRGGSGTTTARSGGDLAARPVEKERDTTVSSATRTSKDEERSLRSKSKSAGGEERESGHGSPAPAPSVPASGENSVYRIGLDGSVREVFREKALVLSLLRQGSHFFVGTGMDGRLFEVNEATRERSEIARLDHGQILCMCRRHDGSIVLGTGDPGKLYVLQDRHDSRGTVASEVLDAKLLSRWGSLRWQADTPTGTKVTVACRSGNVSEPDDTWSDWSAEQADGDQAVIAAPPARFVQYRVTLATENPAATPAVRSVTLRYATTNQAPEITRVEVPDLDAVNLDNPKKLKFKWSATDANEDELTYQVWVRKEGWKSWVLLEEELDKTEYEWDTTTTPSGLYRLKVVASDRKDNSEKEALTGERVSTQLVVSHEPPAVRVTAAPGADGVVAIEAGAAAPLVRLTSAAFAVNGKKWVNVFPADGLFDSKKEAFRFRTDTLEPGTYVLVLRVRDAAGNTGSGDVVFTVPGRK